MLPGLYVGNYQDSKDADQLERFEITHILAIHDTARRLHSVSIQRSGGFHVRVADDTSDTFHRRCAPSKYRLPFSGQALPVHLGRRQSRSELIAVLLPVQRLHSRRSSSRRQRSDSLVTRRNYSQTFRDSSEAGAS